LSVVHLPLASANGGKKHSDQLASDTLIANHGAKAQKNIAASKPLAEANGNLRILAM
jgi:hypothetical protein